MAASPIHAGTVGLVLIGLLAGTSLAIAQSTVMFRSLRHYPLAPGTLSVSGSSPKDTLVVGNLSSGLGGAMTVAGPSRSWSVALAPVGMTPGDSIEVALAATYTDGDPDIRMLSAHRELTEKSRLHAQGILKAKRTKEMGGCPTGGGNPADSVTISVQVLQGKVVVHTNTRRKLICGPDDVIECQSTDPDPSGMAFAVVNSLPVRTISWRQTQTFTLNGVGLPSGTGVVMREIAPPFLVSIDSVKVRGHGVGQLRYLDESMLPLTPPSGVPATSAWVVGWMCAILGVRGDRVPPAIAGSHRGVVADRIGGVLFWVSKRQARDAGVP